MLYRKDTALGDRQSVYSFFDSNVPSDSSRLYPCNFSFDCRLASGELFSIQNDRPNISWSNSHTHTDPYKYRVVLFAQIFSKHSYCLRVAGFALLAHDPPEPLMLVTPPSFASFLACRLEFDFDQTQIEHKLVLASYVSSLRSQAATVKTFPATIRGMWPIWCLTQPRHG